LSLKKNLAQKIFGLNLFLKNRQISFTPQTQWAALCAALESVSKNDMCLVMVPLYASVKTYFIKNS